jgi:site-specific DNA recombinase
MSITTAAIYIRVSTEDQARHGYSLASQVEACRNKAYALGAKQILQFGDEGVSGALLERPGLSSLREALRTGGIDLVVVMDPDRLARNLSHQLLITEEIEKARVQLDFVNFEWRNTAEGQLFYAVRGAIAQFEKEKIKERTSRGRQQKAKSGKLPLGFKPYGYDYDPETSLLKVNEQEALVIRDMFRWLLEEGEGANGIARRLNSMGVPSKKGGTWHRVVVRQILMNEVYTGRFHVNRYNTSGYGLNRHRAKEARVSATIRPREEWNTIQVPQLIPDAVYQHAQRILANARRLWAGQAKADYLLSGLVVCGTCGMTMSGHTGKNWGEMRRVYTCRRAYQGAPEGACNRRVIALPVEDAVWKQVMEWLDNPEALREEMEQGTDLSIVEREMEELEGAVQKVHKGRSNIMAVMEQGLVTPTEAKESLTRIGERERELNERKRELSAVVERSHISAAEMEAWRQLAGDWIRRFASGEVGAEDKKQLVRLLVSKVTVQEGNLVLYARWPGLFGGEGSTTKASEGRNVKSALVEVTCG